MGYGGTILIPRPPHGVPNIVRVIKSRRMWWAGHVARTGEGTDVYRFLAGRPEGKRPFGRQTYEYVGG
jgi:hypothetical protein